MKGHLTQAEITSKYGVHSSQIYNWKKQLENNLANIFKDKSLIEKPDKDLIEELYNKIGKLNMELEWLKKNQNYSAQIKRQLIDASSKDISITRQCELQGLSRSSFYYQPALADDLTLTLLNLIDEYYTAHPEYGTRTMLMYLKNLGYDVNRKRVQGLYKTLGIEAIYQKPRT